MGDGFKRREATELSRVYDNPKIIEVF